MPDGLTPEIKALAVTAGLGLALADYPDDIVAAAAAARTATEGLVLPHDRLAEPWPPMQVGSPA